MMQFGIWAGHWVQPERTTHSVRFWAILLPIFGILVAVKHGKAAISRAVFVVLNMEICLWTGHFFGSEINKRTPISEQRWRIWALVVFVLLTLSLARYSLVAFEALDAKREPQDRVRHQ